MHHPDWWRQRNRRPHGSEIECALYFGICRRTGLSSESRKVSNRNVQIQPPWFLGEESAGGGPCPLYYIDVQACLPGLLIIVAAAAWNSYINSNRLLITKDGFGMLKYNPSDNGNDEDLSQFEETVLFSEVKNWFMTLVGLLIRSSTINFFPLFWDTKSVEAVLEERIDQ